LWVQHILLEGGKWGETEGTGMVGREVGQRQRDEMGPNNQSRRKEQGIDCKEETSDGSGVSEAKNNRGRERPVENETSQPNEED